MDPEEYLQKCSNMKCQRVQVDGSFVPAIQDEAMEVEHLLAEPRNDHVSVDGILYFREENLGKCCAVESLSCGFEFGLGTSIGKSTLTQVVCGSDSHKILNGKDDLNVEVLDGLLDDVGIDDLNATDGFSCEDFLLDFDFADKAVGHCGESLLLNSNSDSHSPGLSGSSNGVGGVSESSKVATEQSEVTRVLHGAFRNDSGQTSIEGGICNSLDMQHPNELDDDPALADSTLSCKKEEGSVEECQTAALRERRSRKPTLRYIEEFSNLRPKNKVLTAAIKNKHSSAASYHQLHQIRLRALRNIPDKNSDNRTSDVALPELQVHQGCLRNEELEYNEASFTSESDDECVTPKRYRKNDRRKHQRMWTLSEVIKLVDGISEFGVGRWTDIKRLLFSASSYRTPIDLRDKWRNLLRASSAQKFNKKETEQKQQHALRSLPSSVLRRIRELAKIHPYPRERCSMESLVGQVGSSAIPTRTKGSPNKRNVRKKCT